MSDTTRTYIFLDESGKPEVFSSTGSNLVERGVATRYLVLAAVRSPDQMDLQRRITAFKSELLHDTTLTSIFSSAYALDAFHATVDYVAVRERFYAFIANLDVKIDVVVVEKRKCHEPLQRQPGKLYGVMSGLVLRDLCHQADQTEIIFSRKDSKLRLRNELELEVERIRLEYLDKHPGLETNGVSVKYKHNPHYSHGGLQVADYAAFAVFKLFEHGDRRWYDLLKGKIGKVHDVCNKKYFTRSSPL